MKSAFPIVAGPDHFPRRGVAVVVRRTVDGVDVRDHKSPCRYFNQQDPAFEVPFHRPRRGGGDVAAEERADAVEFAPEAGGVVAVAGQAEVGVVEVAARGVGFVLIVRVQRRVDGAADGGLGLRSVGGGDLDFLEAEDVGPVPSLEVCAE